MKRTKTDEQLFVKFGVSMPPDLAARLKERMKKEDRSKAYMIKKAVEFYLEHTEKAESKMPPFQSRPVRCPALCKTKNASAS